MTHRSVALVLAAAALAGCSDPYTAEPAPSTTPDGEIPGRIPQAERERLERSQRPARTSDEAIRRHATLVTNWTGQNVVSQYRAAARAAVGQARRDTEQTAASVQNDPALSASSSVANIVGVIAQAGGWTLVITRERLTPDSGPARFRVYRAHTRRVAGGFAVDAWEPQP